MNFASWSCFLSRWSILLSVPICSHKICRLPHPLRSCSIISGRCVKSNYNHRPCPRPRPGHSQIILSLSCLIDTAPAPARVQSLESVFVHNGVNMNHIFPLSSSIVAVDGLIRAKYCPVSWLFSRELMMLALWTLLWPLFGGVSPLIVTLFDLGRSPR